MKMPQGAPLGKKPTACVPCHDRKVRCDLAVAGVPCTRCITTSRGESCALLQRGGKVSNKRKRLGLLDVPSPLKERHPQIESLSPDRSQQLQTLSTRLNENVLQDARLLTPTVQDSSHEGSSWSQPITRSSCPSHIVSLGPITDRRPETVEYMESEDDAHLHTLRRMNDDDPDVSSPVPLTYPAQGQQVVEYYGDMNSVSILGEVLGQSQRRLIRIDLPGPPTAGAQQREFSYLDQADIDYLTSKRVHETPRKTTCRSILRLFFEHVYPYTPILNRQQLVDDFAHAKCSSFLLWSIFAVTAPYAPLVLLHEAGWADIYTAQKDCCSKAKLLYDFGCEKSQLVLIQGSLLLSSIQYSFNLDKDWRFWFQNSVRIATQMGFDRREIGKYLDTTTHRLVRRIWWVLFGRDVWFSLAGFENSRWIHENEPCIEPLVDDDWLDEVVIVNHADLIPCTTSVQRHFLQQNSQLGILGARCLHMFARSHSFPSREESMEFTKCLTTWRSSLPDDLLIDRTNDWNSGNAWVLFLWAMSFRLECSFYRMLRHCTRECDPEIASWAHAQLLPCTFELDTAVKRAIVHGVAMYLPPAILICASHLLSFQLEIALDSTRNEAQRLAARTQTNTILGYLHEVEDRWRNAKWICRVFEAVMDRLGFGTRSENANPERLADSVCYRQSQGQQSSMVHPNIGFDVGIAEGLPDRWFEDLLAQNILNGQEYGWLGMLGS